MAKTVAPLFLHPVAHLARQLRVSRQRASKLLNDGRIEGAYRDVGGLWWIPCVPTITAGSRGPSGGPTTWRFLASRSPKPLKAGGAK